MNPQRKFGVFLLLLVIAFLSQAQSINNVEAKIVEDNLVVSYEVIGFTLAQRYHVQLYSSHDDFSEPLTGDNITGKVGERVGLESKNDILIENPLDVVQGVTRVSFKVFIELVSYPVTVLNPKTDFAQRRKRKMEVVWRGGLESEPVKFDLYRFDELFKDDFYTVQNNGSAEFKMPKVDKGDGYVMKMQFPSLPDPVPLPPMKVKAKKSAFSKIVGISFLLAAVDFALYAGSQPNTPNSELGGFIFKNFDPLGLGSDEDSASLPDPPNPGQSMISIRF